MKRHCNYAAYLVAKGGPYAEDYADVDGWVSEIGDHLRCGRLSHDEVSQLIDVCGDAFTTETMPGHAFQKPHGYAGDFEIIDRIYQRYESSLPHLTKWDKYWQNHAAAHAVRNRVAYFTDRINPSFSIQGQIRK